MLNGLESWAITREFILGRNVYVARCVNLRDAVTRSLATNHHALPQSDFLKADAFVVKSLTSPGQRVEWMAKLGGLAIVSSDYIMGSNMAPWIKFKGIAELPPVRHPLMDKRFQEKHPSLTAILKQQFGKPKSMWRITVACKKHF